MSHCCATKASAARRLTRTPPLRGWAAARSFRRKSASSSRLAPTPPFSAPSTLAAKGETILCEAITYPGARAISAQLGLNLIGLPMDHEGIEPDALADACARLRPKALYLNPTLQNPTTLTVPAGRRSEIAAVARRYGLPIIEDDAYGFIPPHGPAPFAALAPELTWHIAGLAKCIGAGMRAAYVVAPDARRGWPFAAAVRAANVMASPFTVALATRWIEDGTADQILRFIRAEAAARQALASEILPPGSFKADPLSFNIWAGLPAGWNSLGLLRPYALDRNRRRGERRVHGGRRSAGSRARLPGRPDDPRGVAPRARIYGARSDGIACSRLRVSLSGASPRAPPVLTARGARAPPSGRRHGGPRGPPLVREGRELPVARAPSPLVGEGREGGRAMPTRLAPLRLKVAAQTIARSQSPIGAAPRSSHKSSRHGFPRKRR